MIRYLAQKGYSLRYQPYGEASSPEELMDETMDEDDPLGMLFRLEHWKETAYKNRWTGGFVNLIDKWE